MKSKTDDGWERRNCFIVLPSNVIKPAFAAAPLLKFGPRKEFRSETRVVHHGGAPVEGWVIRYRMPRQQKHQWEQKNSHSRDVNISSVKKIPKKWENGNEKYNNHSTVKVEALLTQEVNGYKEKWRVNVLKSLKSQQNWMRVGIFWHRSEKPPSSQH